MIRTLLRQTQQKTLLQEIIMTFDSFFTAEQLHQKLKKRDSHVGIATVYRFLKQLTQQHKLHTYLCDRRTLYSFHKKSHGHFICQKCKRVIDLDIRSLDFLKKKVTGSICHFQIDVEGICENCQ